MSDFKQNYLKYKTERDFYRKELKNVNKSKKRLKRNIKEEKDVLLIFQEVAAKTQTKFTETVEKLVTMALQDVYDKNFRFKLILERKRSKIECRPTIKEGKFEYDLKTEKGGGLIPIISIAMRIVLWQLMPNRTRNIFILDEPIKCNLGGEMILKTFAMLKSISEKMGVQIILVTHHEDLKDIADKVFEVRQENGISYITEI